MRFEYEGHFYEKGGGGKKERVPFIINIFQNLKRRERDEDTKKVIFSGWTFNISVGH